MSLSWFDEMEKAVNNHIESRVATIERQLIEGIGEYKTVHDLFVENARLAGLVAHLRMALQQIACPHTRRHGGNDYLACSDCYLEWGPPWDKVPTPAEIAANALSKT